MVISQVKTPIHSKRQNLRTVITYPCPNPTRIMVVAYFLQTHKMVQYNNLEIANGVFLTAVITEDPNMPVEEVGYSLSQPE